MTWGPGVSVASSGVHAVRMNTRGDDKHAKGSQCGQSNQRLDEDEIEDSGLEELIPTVALPPYSELQLPLNPPKAGDTSLPPEPRRMHAVAGPNCEGKVVYRTAP